ncbi:MAG: glycine cleavage system protein H [Desulfobacterales bacterium]
MKRVPSTNGKDEKKQVQGFQVLDNECIWMKAGVVNFRKCDNAYDCSSCPFDKGMRRAMGIEAECRSEQAAPQWVSYLMKKYHGANRPCRHALSGRIEAPKICTHNYECWHCAFDQMLDDVDLMRETMPPDYVLASGFRLAKGCYYHMGHTWARFEHGGRVRIGFDDFMVRLFGAAGRLSLPPLGGRLIQSQVGWTFGRNGHEAAVLSPVTGRVLAVNPRAQAHPEITHEDPYQQGWQIIMEPDMPKRNLKGLYFGSDSFRWMEGESRRLMALLGDEYQDLAATGAEALGDLFGAFAELDWNVLVSTFLGTEST